MGRLPDFIIGGAARSGTTWLCHLLARHPQVGLAQPIAPEPKFFLVDDLFEHGLDYYSARWFDGLDRPVIGEKTTNYLESASAAARISAALPRVRLVFILRDPVDRAFSNYRWSRMNGHETKEFVTAVELENRRETPFHLRFARPFDYLARGRYETLLRPYLERFDRDRILLLRFEDVLTAPGFVAARLHRFLGVEERAGDAQGLGRINESEKGLLPAATRAWLAPYFRDADRDLARATGFDVSIWSSQRPSGSPTGQNPSA